MHAVGETYEQNTTGAILTVVEVGETWHTFGFNGRFKQKLVPRLTLAVVIPAGTALGIGQRLHETVPSGDLRNYGYTRLA